MIICHTSHHGSDTDQAYCVQGPGDTYGKEFMYSILMTTFQCTAKVTWTHSDVSSYRATCTPAQLLGVHPVVSVCTGPSFWTVILQHTCVSSRDLKHGDKSLEVSHGKGQGRGSGHTFFFLTSYAWGCVLGTLARVLLQSPNNPSWTHAHTPGWRTSWLHLVRYPWMEQGWEPEQDGKTVFLPIMSSVNLTTSLPYPPIHTPIYPPIHTPIYPPISPAPHSPIPHHLCPSSIYPFFGGSTRSCSVPLAGLELIKWIRLASNS